MTRRSSPPRSSAGLVLLLLPLLVACEAEPRLPADTSAPATLPGSAAPVAPPEPSDPAPSPATTVRPQAMPPSAAPPTPPPAASATPQAAATPSPAPAAPTPSPLPLARTPGEVPRIPVTEALARIRSGDAVLVDVRDPASWSAQHIAGALHVPLGELSERMHELPRDRQLITYCA